MGVRVLFPLSIISIIMTTFVLFSNPINIHNFPYLFKIFEITILQK